MITTTLNRIREQRPCEEGWTRLLSFLGKTKADDDPIEFATIVESNGIEDALWCCCAEPQHSRLWRLYAVWCARQVQHLMTEQISIDALTVAEKHANGEATDEELNAAWAAARDAVLDAARDAAVAAAGDAARDAAVAAAGDAAWDAAGAAAGAAARAATRDAAGAAAWDASRDAAWDAAGDAARDAQKQKFLELVTTGSSDCLYRKG